MGTMKEEEGLGLRNCQGRSTTRAENTGGSSAVKCCAPDPERTSLSRLGCDALETVTGLTCRLWQSLCSVTRHRLQVALLLLNPIFQHWEICLAPWGRAVAPGTLGTTNTQLCVNWGRGDMFLRCQPTRDWGHRGKYEIVVQRMALQSPRDGTA